MVSQNLQNKQNSNQMRLHNRVAGRKEPVGDFRIEK